jgi:hypothetical protein
MGNQRTISEKAFEKFLQENCLTYQQVSTVQGAKRPDYLVEIDGTGDRLFFEVKEIAVDENFSTELGVVSSLTVGDHIRRKIQTSRGQVQYGAGQGLPSVLLIYNALDPLHMFGTEDLDFLTAMYGELTMTISKATMKSTGLYHGANDYLQPAKNTSFSALARLAPINGKLTITLFENAYSKNSVPYESLPPCFDVRRHQISSVL